MKLTVEELKMVCLALEDRGDWYKRKLNNDEEQDKYYSLAAKFRKLKNTNTEVTL